MDVSTASKNVMNNLVSSGLLKGEKPAANTNKSVKDQEQSQIQRSNSLLSGIDTDTKEGREALMKRASKIDAKLLTQEYAMQFMIGTSSTTQGNTSIQSALSKGDTSSVRALLNSIDASALGYKGKALGSLTSEEAKKLIADDGFFGVKQTSDRIADFVIMGAGDNLDKLKRGREGVERGLKEASKVWGGDLPDISQRTVETALKRIDERIKELETPKSTLVAKA